MASFIVEQFYQIVSKLASSYAVMSSKELVTYNQLGDLTGGIASVLSHQSQEPNTRVAIFLDKGAALYASMLACLQAGCLYSNLPKIAPAARREAALKEFRPDIVICNKNVADDFSEYDCIFIEDMQPQRMTLQRPHTLAYVLFTSGSTGAPKGVVISVKALEHYVKWALENMAFGPGERCSQFNNPRFDFSCLDIYGSLCSGTLLIPLEPGVETLFPGLMIQRYGITIWNSVPSVVDMMKQANQVTTKNLSTLKQINFCGEPVRFTQLETLFAALPHVVINNIYGPTEATVSCSLRRFTKGELATLNPVMPVSFGSAIPGMKFHIPEIDDNGIGELALEGEQLAEGYLLDGRLYPFMGGFRHLKDEGEIKRVYYTGDLVRVKDGEYFFISRNDDQVKIKGYRVELDEIRCYLHKIGFSELELIFKNEEIYAFLVNSVEAPKNEAQVRERLSTSLENYAIPHYLFFLEALPRTPSGKIDRASLLEMTTHPMEVMPQIGEEYL